MIKQLLLLTLLVGTLSDSRFYEEICHIKHRFPKAITLTDGDVLVLSTSADISAKASIMSVYDRQGVPVYGNVTFTESFDGSAEPVQSNIGVYHLLTHESHDVNGVASKENILNFGDQYSSANKFTFSPSIKQKKSAINLQNGVIAVGAIEKEGNTASLSLVNPAKEKIYGGETFTGFSKFISCTEVKKSNLYCAYVGYEDPFISKLKVRHYTYSCTGGSGEDTPVPEHNITKKTTYDLLFIIDSTSSMTGTIKAVQNYAKKIAEKLNTELKDFDIKYGAIYYQDPRTESKEKTTAFDFTDDLAAFETFIGKQKAVGGGDLPEDWVSAYTAAKSLSWRDGIKLIIHIADAGAHGPNYSSGDKLSEEQTKMDDLTVDFCKMENLYIKGFKIGNRPNDSFKRMNQKCAEYRKNLVSAEKFTGENLIEIKDFDQTNTDPTYFTGLVLSSSIEIANKMEMTCELTFQKEQVIKTFYTQFNFLKAIKIVDDEFAILFQSGKHSKLRKYGDKGHDLFYYQLKIEADGYINAKRYEFLYDYCKYKDDSESYNNDIAVFHENKLYAVCENEDGKLHGMIINRDDEEIVHFDFQGDKLSYPTFAKFGQNLGIFYSKDSKTTAFQIMNFPNCIDYPLMPIKIPLHRGKQFDLKGYVNFLNPYPEDRKNEQVYVYFKDLPKEIDVKLDNGESIVPEKRENASFFTVFVDKEPGNYTLKYTSLIKDSYFGEIIGKTCNVEVKTPVCHPGCYTCCREKKEPLGHDFCLDSCKVGYYKYEYPDPDPEPCEWGKTFDCIKCFEGCTACNRGPDYEPWTHCLPKQCDNENGYYYVEHNETLCYNETMIRKHEVIMDNAYFLYTNETTKEKYWKMCHHNCGACRSLGDSINNLCTKCRNNSYFNRNPPKEKDYHFMHYQVEENHTIPGSCYNDKEGNGYYVEPKDDKYHPCLDHCKVCQNASICENCYPNWYLRYLTHDGCDKNCTWEQAYDNDTWKCVNCRTEYQEPMWNWRQKCYELTDPDMEECRNHNKEFNLCKICDKTHRCWDCIEEFTDKCTKCWDPNRDEKPTFMEHMETPPQRDWFHCYFHDECADLGGVPDFTEKPKLCRNCRLTAPDTYRKVVDQTEKPYECIESKPTRPNRTHICDGKEYYNALCKCYTPCETCDRLGNVEKHWCTWCRNDDKYELQKLADGTDTTNCVRIVILPCHGNPYWFDYDAIDPETGEEGTNVCVTEDRCPAHHPFFVAATHECVEKCMFTDFFNGVCLVNNTAAAMYAYLKNPFNVMKTHESLKGTIFAEIVTKAFATYGKELAASLDVNFDLVIDVLKNGKPLNLPKSKIISGGNGSDYSIEFTSVALQKKELEDFIKKGIEGASTSKVELCDCEKTLKEKYSLPEEEDLLIIKGDLVREDLTGYAATEVQYVVFSTSLQLKLDLNYCRNERKFIDILQSLSKGTFVKAISGRRSLQEAEDMSKKIDAVLKDGYDPFTSDGTFYSDVCSPFTSEDGTDVLIEDRKSDYFGQFALCPKSCGYQGYNATSRMYTCRCVPQNPEDREDFEEFVPATIHPNFNKQVRRSNIAVFKCSKLAFSNKGVKNNAGFAVLLVLFLGFIAASVLYIIKGKQWLNAMLNNSRKSKEAPVKDDIQDPSKTNRKISPKTSEQLSDEELNAVDYSTAKNKDKRSFLKIYWSLIRQKQLIIYTFLTKTEYALRIVKVSLFLLFFAFFMFFNALFYTDDVIRAVYKYKGNMTAAIHVPNLILSSLCCFIMNSVIRYLLLSEKDIIALKFCKKEQREKKITQITKCLHIKLLCLFGISVALTAMFWYYVTAFCAVFKNSQGYYFLNVFLTFIICNLYPFVFSTIAPILRLKALKSSKGQTMYKASQILAFL